MTSQPDARAGAEDRPLEELMQAFQAGDVRAFEELYRRLAPRVFGFLLSMGRDRALAEDLCQTTFLKVHRARASYLPGARVEPWVLAIARRSFIDAWRRDQRAPTSLSSDGKVPEVAVEPGSDEANAGGRAGLQQLLEGALKEMPASQSEALVLLKVQGLSLVEAAAVAGTTVGAMKVRAHRAYEHLRRALGREGKR